MDDKQGLDPVPLASPSGDELVVRSPMLAKRGLEQLGAQTLLASALETLALAIAATNGVQPGAFLRVPSLATALAVKLGTSPEEMQGVTTAALLHDIGKLAVPPHVLSKLGPLTQEEFQKIRVHSQAGAEIISAVPFPYPVAPLILSHHERWDGKGYPQGLKGEEIPMGARILSVVDYYCALTSDRPYHKAMAAEEAMALLQQEAGRALDPAVVQVFVKMAGEMEAVAGPVEAGALRRLSLETNSERGHSTDGFSPQTTKTSAVFEDIALAHREIHGLYEIARTMGTALGVSDTMALISSKLSSLVPYSACALFLFDEEADSLRCRFATGVEADAIGMMTMRAGQGLAGWVARNRRTLVNARPSAEFEAAGLATTTELQSALVVPLVFSDRFIGTLAVYATQPDFYADDHRRLLDHVSEQVSAVIHNSIVFEQTQEDALTDLLTGLPNTRFLFMHLTRELGRAERLKAEVSLLVMDVDNFKEINNAYGDRIGDCALSEIATALRSGISPYDICVRYSGDEFMVVLSGCGAAGAAAKRLELQRLVDAVKFEPQSGKSLKLSISTGVAVYPSDGVSFETLLATADIGLRRDKLQKKKPARV